MYVCTVLYNARSRSRLKIVDETRYDVSLDWSYLAMLS